MTHAQEEARRRADGRRCPPLADLLVAAHGELPRMQQWRTLVHVWRCRACQADIQDWRELSELVRTEDASPVSYRPPPDADTYARFLQRLHQQERELARVKAPSTRRWVATAALLTVAVSSLLLTQGDIPVMSAQALLDRAAAEESARPVGTAVRVRYALTSAGIGQAPAGQLSLIRDVPDASRTASPPPAADIPAALNTALVTYGFDWRHPLSLASVRAWRAKNPQMRDEVSTSRERLLTIRSVARSGVPPVVEIDMRADTYHVIRQTLVFAGIGRFEVTELDTWEREERATSPTGESAARISEADLQLAELDARLALQQTGLDVAGTARVTPGQPNILVTGSAKSEQTRRAAMSLLDASPHVQATLQVADRPRVAWPVGRGFKTWLDVAYRSAGQREKYTTELTTLAARIPIRLSIMKDLATRYPASSTRSAAARQRLDVLVSRHYNALYLDLLALRAQMSVAFGTNPKRPSTPEAPSDWRTRATRAEPQARALERQLRTFVGSATDMRARPTLNEAFDELWETAIGRSPSTTEQPPPSAAGQPGVHAAMNSRPVATRGPLS